MIFINNSNDKVGKIRANFPYTETLGKIARGHKFRTWEIQTGVSSRSVIEKLKSITDGRMLNTFTGKEIIRRGEITEEIQALLNKINSPR